MAESELYHWAFWKRAAAVTVQAAAACAVGVLGSNGIDTLRDVPWQGLASSAGFAGLVVLLGAISGAKIRDTAPGNPETTAAAVIASLKVGGRHAKPDDTQEAKS